MNINAKDVLEWCTQYELSVQKQCGCRCFGEASVSSYSVHRVGCLSSLRAESLGDSWRAVVSIVQDAAAVGSSSRAGGLSSGAETAPVYLGQCWKVSQ